MKELFAMTLNVSSDKKCPTGTRSLHWKMQNKGVWGTPQQAFCNAKSVFV